MTEILEFVKALSDRNRLRIVGVLSRQAATRAELAARLDLPLKVITDHLADLEQVGAITHEGQSFLVNDERLTKIAREKLAMERPVYVPAEDLDEKSKKILKAHLNADGSIKLIPAQPAKLKVILEYLLPNFELGVNYTEKQVNFILSRFHEDTAALRRELFEVRMLDRESDGSRYWRVK
jgi:hypothetical protein